MPWAVSSGEGGSVYPAYPIYDGLVVNIKKETWQDKEYVSPTAVFEGDSKKQGIRLHPNERARYEELKKIYDERKYGNK